MEANWKVALPKGRVEFGKCLSVLRKLYGASYDSATKTWTVVTDGGQHGNQCLSVLSYCAERGATVEEMEG